MNVLRVIAPLAVAALLPAGASTAAASEAAPTFKNYVALGDSYTAAPLVPPLDLSNLGCLRSGGGNYPALAAPKLKVPKVTDVSCGGADTTHVKTGQATPTGFVPPQMNALTKQTDLVTIGLGANDFGLFADLLAVCPSLQKSDPDGAPCKKQFSAGGKDQLKENVAKTKTRLVELLKTVKAKIAPKATIVLVGYPRIAPAQGNCPDLPLAKGDYAYLNATETELNTAIQAAAKQGGAKYLDVFKPSEGHDVCAKDKAWLQGATPDLLKAASYHPRAEEQTAVADLLVKLLSGSKQTITAADQSAWSPTLATHREQAAKTLADPAKRRQIESRLAKGGLFSRP
ncbi:GDSL family lipase [Kribbella sp. ALI-6-A]|uniref:SGNH/GDSL hydrolase family protein n=1 Tax=Kribbella sp. ALI-6-A TaxID=1933817 RepID=UPI00097BFC81|nr:SGNH/GDSL hydrolase family protein [Kribbella sp. ALI-6-A]ONI73882.1 GDSL family lipase [Kribbella sp. ALI-6-A]